MSTSPSGHAHDEVEEHDLGLAHDLPTLLERRRSMGRRGLLGLMGGVGAAAALTACGSDGGTSSVTTGGSGAEGPGGPGGRPGGMPSGMVGRGGGPESSVAVADGEIPEETAGPYPGDGSNGQNILTESGIVRSDITTSIGDASGVAEGVPVTVKLRIYDLDGEAATPLEGAALYIWHATREGEYSMYSSSVASENYLRGVQVADADGRVEFTTIFPGCYDGRWPHMHFEVYRSSEDATTYQNKLRTSQLALPQDACETVYSTAAGYETSVDNLARITLDSDMVFSDGYSLQMAKTTGSVDEGYTVSLGVPV